MHFSQDSGEESVSSCRCVGRIQFHVVVGLRSSIFYFFFLAVGHGHSQLLEAACICSVASFIFKVSNSESSTYLVLNLSIGFV